MGLADRVLKGERLALARLLTLIENQDLNGLNELAALYPHTGRAHIVGVTGAPGTGKSTLVNRLALQLREPAGDEGGSPEHESPAVAIVAVDPSSPFSGGAILGDRIRMRDLAGNPGVFIRSMASRGALGGLARATADMVKTLDAAGFGIILVETVGAGQAEVDIAKTAHTTVVVHAPGLGDDVQAIKAGILEIADILVVNKADLPGAQNSLMALRMALELGRVERQTITTGTEEGRDSGAQVEHWEVPVLPTTATTGDGIRELSAAVHEHRAHLAATGQITARERARVKAEMEELLRDTLAHRFFERHPDGRFEDVIEQVLSRKLAPRQAIQTLLEGLQL